MNYIDPDIAALFRTDVNTGIYFRLGTSPALRFWCGVNDAPQHMVNVEIADETYIGAGKLLGLPKFDVLLSGASDRAEFYLEGASPESVAMIETKRPVVQGAQFQVGVAPLDDYWQPRSGIWPLVEGAADYWSLEYVRAKGKEKPVRRLALSVGFGETGRGRPRRVTYTPPHQKAAHPGDEFCRNVARLNAGYVLTWPRFK